ncbi:keratin-like protein KRT222 isoform X2 [Spea bombifrons]|uniref:keratin-like protein KRT222 isoform X2 n=1 Tax=Spea bombifrons TaxID=233779 RepID=UPI00234ACA13|nr:keratin-like protein KRT222 isoform X2 [Spea bombifrons]
MDFFLEKSMLLESASISDHKSTLKQLNERLAGFIRCSSDLEESNMALQRKIEEHLKTAEAEDPNWKDKFKEIHNILDSIYKTIMENASTALLIDNQRRDLAITKARLGEEIFYQKQCAIKNKLYETMGIEWRDCITELEFIIKDKEEEKRNLISDHQEAVGAVQQLIHPIDDIQFATVEDGSRMELSQLLNEIRANYEALIGSCQIHEDLSTRTEIEEEARRKMQKDEEELREARANISEARRQWKSLQQEIESLQALERSLEYTLQATKRQHQKQLENLTAVIVSLEEELKEVREGVRTQLQKHRMLLNANMKLEQEIAAYRSLLEKEEARMNGVKYLQEQKPPTGKTTSSWSPGATDLQETFQKRRGDAFKKEPSSLHDNIKSSSIQKCTVVGKKTTKQPIFNGNIAEEGAEASGRIQTEKVGEVIKKWEGSFFKDNPKLRKKSVSLRFDLHLAAADEGRPDIKQDELPDVEVRLIMRRSCSIPSMSP